MSGMRDRWSWYGGDPRQKSKAPKSLFLLTSLAQLVCSALPSRDSEGGKCDRGLAGGADVRAGYRVGLSGDLRHGHGQGESRGRLGWGGKPGSRSAG